MPDDTLENLRDSMTVAQLRTLDRLLAAVERENTKLGGSLRDAVAWARELHCDNERLRAETATFARVSGELEQENGSLARELGVRNHECDAWQKLVEGLRTKARDWVETEHGPDGETFEEVYGIHQRRAQARAALLDACRALVTDGE